MRSGGGCDEKLVWDGVKIRWCGGKAGEIVW